MLCKEGTLAPLGYEFEKIVMTKAPALEDRIGGRYRVLGVSESGWYAFKAARTPICLVTFRNTLEEDDDGIQAALVFTGCLSRLRAYRVICEKGTLSIRQSMHDRFW